MKRPNNFVLAVVVCVNLSTGILVGHHQGSLNGVLEMDGFKATFSDLYRTTGTDSDQMTSSGDLPYMENQTIYTKNYSQPDFCGLPPKMSEAKNATKTCGSGNTAGSASTLGLVTSSVGIGGAIGAFAGGWLSDQFSRTYGLAIGTVILMIGNIVSSASYHIWVMIVGRFTGGIGVGIMYMVAPLYCAEATPKDSRGFLVSLLGPSFSIGLLFALCSNIGFAKFSVGWRVAISVTSIFSLVYIIVLVKFIPHSPRWLLRKNRDQEALSVLNKINRHSSKETFVDTFLEMEELRESTRTFAGTKVRELFQWKYIYRISLLMILFSLPPLIGTFILSYITTFFCEVGVLPFYAALAVGVTLLLASLLQSTLIDKFGRKVLFFVFSTSNIITALAVAALSQVCSSPSGVIAYVIVILMCLYSFGYASSWLTLPWVINSEVFPTNVRSLTFGFNAAFFWVIAFAFTQVVPLMLRSSLGVHGFMYFLAGVNLFGFFFVLFALPETKGVSLEEMDKLFSQNLCCSNSSSEVLDSRSPQGIQDEKYLEYKFDSEQYHRKSSTSSTSALL